MSGGGGSGNSNDGTYEANIARDRENARQVRITNAQAHVNNNFDAMFTPEFFAARGKGLIDYQKPQLDDQFAGARKQLTYWLGDRGLLDSSVRNDKTADLQKTYDTGLRGINNAALDLQNREKDTVESTRQSLLRDTLSANPSDSNAASVASSMQSLSQPETYSPLGDIFGGFTQALATQAALERAAAYSGGAVKPAFNTGLFGPSSGSVRVTN